MYSKSSNATDNHERRQEKRLHIPGLSLQIGKRSFARRTHFSPVELIDFSEGGLAFASDSVEFQELDKVEIKLCRQERQISAQAIICYVRALPEGKQYGLLFINTSEELQSLMGSDALHAMEAQRHAEAVADKVAQLIGHSDQHVQITRQWKLLLKATEAFISRIREIARQNAQTKAELKKAICPINDFLQINPETRTIAFTQLADDDSLQSCMISIAIDDDSGEPVYRIGDKLQTTSVYEVVEHLGQAFVSVYQH
jgi:hypothetical protein